MGNIVYQREIQLKNGTRVSVEVDEKDPKSHRAPNENCSIEIDYETSSFTPTQLIRIGKFLIRQGQIIKKSFDKNGKPITEMEALEGRSVKADPDSYRDRKEASNV